MNYQNMSRLLVEYVWLVWSWFQLLKCDDLLLFLLFVLRFGLFVGPNKTSEGVTLFNF